MKTKYPILEGKVNSLKISLSKFCSYWIFFFIIIIFNSQNLKAIENLISPVDDRNSTELFPLLIQVEGCESYNSDALYAPGGLVYLSIEDLFKYLKIPCFLSNDGYSMTGFIESESKKYSVNVITKEILIQDKGYFQDRGLLNNSGVIFMESSLFGEYFGIDLTFNIRSLSVSVKSNFELPIVRLMKLDKIRSNLNKARGEIIADTAIGRNYHLLRFGNLDWFMQSTQIAGNKTNNRLNFVLGNELFYGEAKFAVNYNTSTKIDSRQLYYLWRWVDNEISGLKQVNLGKINFQSISSVYSPVIGFAASNAPTSIRKAEGHYTINEYTQPNWIVELYINNGLIDYTKADASGLFIFKVPIVYGFTTLELRFYGPMGEERSEQRIINTPYTFTPAGKLEYIIAGGILETNKNTTFARSEFSFGLERSITIGGGLEYLSSIQDGQYIPFVCTSFLPFTKLMVKGEYAHNVRMKGIINYYFWDNALIVLDYSKYQEGQKAILNNILSDTRITLNIPYRLGILSGYSKFGYQQLGYKNFSFNSADFSLSGYYSYFNMTLSTSANWMTNFAPYVYSNLAFSYLIGNGFNFRSIIQFDYSRKKISTYRFEIENKFSDICYLSSSFEHNLYSNYNGFDITLRYNLTFARTSASSRYTNQAYISSQGAQGSLLFDSETTNFSVSDYSMVGRGSITVVPFLDVNNNGKYDDGEVIIKNLKIKINGGKVVCNSSDSLTRIIGLEPFINYLIEVNEEGFENIAWRINKKSMNVTVDPNQFKLIEIPVISMGEVSGRIYLKNLKNELNGIGRILVKIYKTNSDKAIAEALSEPDGYFLYMGLEPGDYVARIDSVQLRNLDFTVDSPEIPFNIKSLKDGDIVEDINFILTKKK